MSDQDPKDHLHTLPHVPNNVMAFNDRVKPLMDEVVRLCEELKIPMVATFQVAKTQTATVTHFNDGQLVMRPLVDIAKFLTEDTPNTITSRLEDGEPLPFREPGQKPN